MKVILLIVDMMEMENINMKMANIILDNLKMVYLMVKVYYMIKMEILNMKVILLMINLKEMRNIIMKMVNIILDNGKMI